MDKLVMSKDRVVARFDSMNHLVWRDDALYPFYLKRTGNLDGWLASRAIDSHPTQFSAFEEGSALGRAR